MWIYMKRGVYGVGVQCNKTVSDGKGLGQPACQEGWKKCKREEE
jgi:hypothetical protein